MLAGPEVIGQTADAYAASGHLPLSQRLVAALKAGENAGGDKRGKQSAALLIHDEQEYPYLDLRVDDCTDPLAELARLESLARGRYLHYRKFMPSNANPAGITDLAELECRIVGSMAEERKGSGSTSSS